MSPVMVPASVPLHEFATRHRGISVISYNVLLPNSQDGWWVFKYYDASTPDRAREWPHRQDLLRTTLLGAMADVVCVQEASGATFSADFGFMIEAGYGAVIHRKYRLRPATFWRADAWRCIHERHRDKVLICVLQSVADPAVIISVLNCHLVAAPLPERRFRQVFDALEQLRKDLVRLDISPAQAAVVVAGDFNAAPEGTATHHLLSGGVVDADFREPGWPETQPTAPYQVLLDEKLGRRAQRDLGAGGRRRDHPHEFPLRFGRPRRGPRRPGRVGLGHGRRPPLPGDGRPLA